MATQKTGKRKFKRVAKTKAGVPKKEAEEIKAKLEAAGAKVELK